MLFYIPFITLLLENCCKIEREEKQRMGNILSKTFAIDCEGFNFEQFVYDHSLRKTIKFILKIRRNNND